MIGEFLTEVKHCQEMILEKTLFEWDKTLEVWTFTSVWMELENDSMELGAAYEWASDSVKASLNAMKKCEIEKDWPKAVQQLEDCLNERPLCAMSENVKECDYVVPNQFVSGSYHKELTDWTKKCIRGWKREMFERMEQADEKAIGKIVMAYKKDYQDERWTVARLIRRKSGKKQYKLRDKGRRSFYIAEEWVRMLPISDYVTFIENLRNYLEPLEPVPFMSARVNDVDGIGEPE